ncbi:MAG: hypothetical protein MnENMB40S_26460 [Rhizobiaceae bacterium MnEN-MB40S]|nr:MAG: hypothetical protein MnENMB40S_26460 [Rhizobiaceae bacterium MnEN-MB40S]
MGDRAMSDPATVSGSVPPFKRNMVNIRFTRGGPQSDPASSGARDPKSAVCGTHSPGNCGFARSSALDSFMSNWQHVPDSAAFLLRGAGCASVRRRDDKSD